MRTRNSIIAFLLLALVPAKSFADTNDQVIAWGPMTNGLQAGIAYRVSSLQGKAYARVTLCLRNAGDKSIRILRLSANARYWGDHLPLEVLQGGTLIRYQGPELEPPPPPAEEEHITLRAGATDSVDVWPVAKYWGLTVADEVEIAFVFQSLSSENRDLWTGEAKSGRIKMKMSSQQGGGHVR